MKYSFYLLKYIAVYCLFILPFPSLARGEEMKCFTQRDQGIRFGVIHSLNSADVRVADDPDAKIYADAIFQTLIQTDPNSKVIQGNIARSWSGNKDNTEYTFQLVNDRTFHNGKIVTSNDVAYTFSRVCSKFKSNLSILGCDNAKKGTYPEGIKVIDPFTIKFILSRPNPHFVQNSSIIAYGIIPANTDPHIEPIGSGPMKVKYLNKGVELCLQKFDGYTGNYPATINFISVVLFKTTEDIITAFKDGKLDVSRAPSSGFPEKNIPEDVAFLLHRDRGTVHLTLDEHNSLFKHVENRKIISSIFFEVAKNKENLYFNEEFSPSYVHKAALPVTYYNRELPKFSLEKCKKIGKESKKPLKILLSTSFFTAEFIANLKNTLDSCKILHVIKVVTSKDYVESGNALLNSQYDITYYARTPVSMLSTVYAYTQEGKMDLGHKLFPNSSYAKRYVSAIYKPDPIEANESFAKIVREMEEDYDVIPLFNHKTIFLYRKDLIIPDYNMTYFLDLARFSWRKK